MPFWTYAIPGLLVYAVIYYILFKFPTILHKKKKFKSRLINEVIEGKGCLHIAHRGGSREHLENTMVAFHHAIAMGTNSLEMDVHITKDGQVVVCHDDDLIRLCGVNKSVMECNYAEIPPFQAQVPLHFSVNMAYDSTKENPQDRRMPLLREVFEAFPNVLINVELKSPTEELLVKTNELVKEFKREHLTIWGCRHKPFSQRLLKLNPEVPMFFPEERVHLVYLAYFFGFLPFINIPEISIQIPFFCKEYQEEVKVAKFSRKIFLLSVKLLSKVSKPLAQHLKRRGCLFVYWVLNNHEDFRRTIEAGAQAVMTDLPTELTKHLKNSNLYIDSAPYLKHPVD